MKKNTARVFSLPLWVIVFCWLLIGRRPDTAGGDEPLGLYLVLDDLFYALPVPRRRLERRMVTRLVEWIRSEQTRLVALSDGVGMIGALSK
jgi:hypothetical protein